MGDLASAIGVRAQEAAIVAELKAGTEEAYAWLIGEFHQPIYSLVYRIVCDPADAADTIEEWFHEAGWEIICKTDRVNPPGYSIHEVGTCRMGNDPKKSVLNKWCQSHDVKNIFVVDGASFVTCGWQNPTMTILSLSMRASEYLAEQMRTNAV